MNLLRPRWSTVCAAVSLGCVFVCPATARAQMFVELGGGWNYVGPVAPSGPFYSGGSNIRASVGWKVAQNFQWRIDAFTNQFDVKTGPLPCPTFGCPASAYLQPERVSGLIANGLVSVDPRGIFYLIGGAGLYDVNGVNLPITEWHFGVSAGAGIAVPVAPHLRVFVEARWHDLLGTLANGPSQIIPITVGLRF